tara:strand:+ start:3745 stop:4350 length:606 start_codon:yes stop_codon:yes gene_type:complete
MKLAACSSLLLTFLVACTSTVPRAPLAKAVEAGQPGIRTFPINEVQGSAYVDDAVYAETTPESARIVISLHQQRAWLFHGDKAAVSTPISTGVPAYPTPSGNFKILEKKEYHESSLYGNYVDAQGNVVLRDVNSRVNKAPPGTTWKGTPVPLWQRLTWDGVGMHIGKLPGQPASHGCLRFPSTVMPLIYAKTRLGTPVTIE